jgi:hypothetical protein
MNTRAAAKFKAVKGLMDEKQERIKTKVKEE